MRERVAARDDGLGLQGLAGRGDRHLGGDDALRVALQVDDVDEPHVGAMDGHLEDPAQELARGGQALDGGLGARDVLDDGQAPGRREGPHEERLPAFQDGLARRIIDDQDLPLPRPLQAHVPSPVAVPLQRLLARWPRR